MNKRNETREVRFDYSALRGKIKEKFGSESDFAKRLVVSRSTLSLKLNNRVEFSQQEMTKITDLLDVPRSELGSYFFTPEVVKSQRINH